MIINNTIDTVLNKEKNINIRRQAIGEIWSLCRDGHLTAKKAVEVLIKVANEETSDIAVTNEVIREARTEIHNILNYME